MKLGHVDCDAEKVPFIFTETLVLLYHSYKLLCIFLQRSRDVDLYLKLLVELDS